MSLRCFASGRRGAFDFTFGFESAGRSVALFGPSGCGKTSFLHALAGLVKHASACVHIDDALLLDDGALRLAPHKRGVGYVFQDVRLFPHMNVRDNIAFSTAYGGDATMVDQALDLMDLGGFGERMPGALSGGEARRVALARALAARPRLLLLDEPFSGLDHARRERLAPYLLRLRDESDIPIILVSHDPRDVDLIAEELIDMSLNRPRGDGA